MDWSSPPAPSTPPPPLPPASPNPFLTLGERRAAAEDLSRLQQGKVATGIRHRPLRETQRNPNLPKYTLTPLDSASLLRALTLSPSAGEGHGAGCVPCGARPWRSLAHIDAPDPSPAEAARRSRARSSPNLLLHSPPSPASGAGTGN